VRPAEQSSVGGKEAAPAKAAERPRKAASGQKEMLMSIEGKKAKEAPAKKPGRSANRRSRQLAKTYAELRVNRAAGILGRCRRSSRAPLQSRRSPRPMKRQAAGAVEQWQGRLVGMRIGTILHSAMLLAFMDGAYLKQHRDCHPCSVRIAARRSFITSTEVRSTARTNLSHTSRFRLLTQGREAELRELGLVHLFRRPCLCSIVGRNH
jgi:hypothetical protein